LRRARVQLLNNLDDLLALLLKDNACEVAGNVRLKSKESLNPS